MAQKERKVALTGGSGFVGRNVLRQLLQAGMRVRALLRDPGKVPVNDGRITVVAGNLFDPDALDSLVSECDAVIHLVGIIMERPSRGQTFERVHVQGTINLLQAARRAGVKRWVQMSALGARPQAVARYHQTKWQAEQAVRNSGLAFTIFRPSIIHGPDGEFMQMVRDFWCKRFPPFVPYFGRGLTGKGGAGRLQPVWVRDVARCFVDALKNDRTINETYPLGGPEAFTWPSLYETVGRHLPTARAKRIMPVPVWYAKMIAGLPGVPFNLDQVIMSQEDSTCAIDKVQEHLGVQLASFEPTLEQYTQELQHA